MPFTTIGWPIAAGSASSWRLHSAWLTTISGAPEGLSASNRPACADSSRTSKHRGLKMAPVRIAGWPRNVTFARTRVVAHVAENTEVALAKSSWSAYELDP